MTIVIRIQWKFGEDYSSGDTYKDVDEFFFNTEEEAHEFVERIRDVLPD
jgi:hypothetical protein